MGDPESRAGQLASYLRHNSERVIVDVVLLATWTLAATELFRWLGLPRWFLYVVLFVGIVIYVRLTPPWERPPWDRD